MSTDGSQSTSSSDELTRSDSPSVALQVPLPLSPSKIQASLFAETLTTIPTSRSPVTILFQEKCFLHRYIRDKDTSGIVERPERLRAVALGFAAGIARLESEQNLKTAGSPILPAPLGKQTEELTQAMSQMNIEESTPPKLPSFCRIIHSENTLDLTTDPAVRFVHADDSPATNSSQDYLSKLKGMAVESETKIRNGFSEIPKDLAQGDLYLCPESWDAISGAAATVCEAVDLICGRKSAKEAQPDNPSTPSTSATTLPHTSSPQDTLSDRTFVVVRPPGHHCGEDTPAGFCFVNNVAIGAAHAYLKHGVERVVVLDIDLHHGNGTQKIAWAINQETHRKELEELPDGKPGLKIFYGSLHDVLSYPCEDGDPELTRDASVSLHDGHGQFIENIHLRPYTSEREFHETLYNGVYSQLLSKARKFLEVTNASPEKTMFFISCGFDACEHEYSSMSRHGRKVPVSFYERIAADVCRMADLYANGKVISVLEGGYSDRALISGAMAHLSGLVISRTTPSAEWDWTDRESWWDIKNLIKLEHVIKRNRKFASNPRPKTNGNSPEPGARWLERTLEIFSYLDRSPSARQRTPVSVPQSNRTLRDRNKKPNQSQASSAATTTEVPVSSMARSKPRRSSPIRPSPNAGVASHKPASTSSAPRNSGSKSVQTTPNSKTRDSSVQVARNPAETKVPKPRRKSAQGVLANSAQPSPISTERKPDPPIPSLPVNQLVLHPQTTNMVGNQEPKEHIDVRSPMTSTRANGDASGDLAGPNTLSRTDPTLKIKIKLPRPPPPSLPDSACP